MKFADLWKGFAAGNAGQGKKEVVMGDRLSGAIITAAVAAAAISTIVATPITQAFAQTPAASGAVPKTSWGEPDLPLAVLDPDGRLFDIIADVYAREGRQNAEPEKAAPADRVEEQPIG